MIRDDKAEIWLLFEQDGVRALDEAEQHLLALEEAPHDESELNGLYRALHSLKGNARVMGLPRLEALTHKTEDVVGFARDKTVVLEGEVFQAVLETCDVVRRAFPDLVTARSDIPEEAVGTASDRLAKLLATLDPGEEKQPSYDAEGDLFDCDFDVELDFDFDAVTAVDGVKNADTEVQAATEPTVETGAVAEGQPVPEVREVAPEPRPVEAPTKAAPPALEMSATGEPSKEAASSERDPGTDRMVAVPRDALIQVRSSKIQELLSIASDLGLSTDSLLANPGIVALREESEDVTEQAHRLQRLMRDLRFSAASLALVPVNDLFMKVRRIGRDLARNTGKAFSLTFDGEDTEIDKSLVDALGDPVLHILRNSVDHGIETAEERRASNKNEKGRIEVSASYSGNEIQIIFSDDGRGIDPEKIAEKAIRKGLIPVDHNLDDASLQRLIFHPGFSTKENVSQLSGRGVGMDVVKETIKRLRGRIEINSTAGQGTALSIYLPLTLAFADALVVEIGSYLYAVPLENVGRIFLPETGDWATNSADGVEYVQLKNSTIPVAWLEGARRLKKEESQRQPIVTVRSSSGEMALPVDVLRGTEQITMRPLDRFSARHPAASSCGILSNGDIALTLDCERLALALEMTPNKSANGLSVAAVHESTSAHEEYAVG